LRRKILGPRYLSGPRDPSSDFWICPRRVMEWLDLPGDLGVVFFEAGNSVQAARLSLGSAEEIHRAASSHTCRLPSDQVSGVQTASIAMSVAPAGPASHCPHNPVRLAGSSPSKINSSGGHRLPPRSSLRLRRLDRMDNARKLEPWPAARKHAGPDRSPADDCPRYSDSF